MTYLLDSLHFRSWSCGSNNDDTEPIVHERTCTNKAAGINRMAPIEFRTDNLICSECHETFLADGDGINHPIDWAFCPNCGARVVGECRSPYGERGLKWRRGRAEGGERGRSPYGERGLKSRGRGVRGGRHRSLPIRGAWVEMTRTRSRS